MKEFEFKCRYDRAQKLVCDKQYCTNQYYDELDTIFLQDKEFITYIGNSDGFMCRNTPELCPRYREYMMQKVKNNVR